MEKIIGLILMIASQAGVPPYFALSVALTENPELRPAAVSRPNRDGSVDRGVMQLNSKYFSGIDWQCPETNIRAGINHIKWLMSLPEVTTYWQAAICYNAGTGWMRDGRPPPASLRYADRVMALWEETDKKGFTAIIGGENELRMVLAD